MNRDVYSIILGKAKTVLEVNLQNANNKWERAYIHDDVVKGFMCCKCLLLCTRNAHPDPNRRQHLIVDSWERLIDIHHPDNLYRVTPLTCSGVNPFLAAMAVASCPGSPFRMDHRIDHVPYRCTLTYKSPVRGAVERCFKNLQAQGKFPANIPIDTGSLPIMGMEFDCVLRAPKDAGLIVVKPTVNPVAINTLVNMMKFIDSPEMWQETGLDPAPWREISPTVRKRHLFLCGESAVQPAMVKPLLEAAKPHNIHLFHKRGLRFEYLTAVGY